MQNSLTFKSGLNIFITQQECADINSALIAGNRFIPLPRIKQNFNIDMIANVGINDLFTDPKVAGADFRFTSNTIVAKLADREAYNQGKGWKPCRDQFDAALTFDQLIASQTVNV